TFDAISYALAKQVPAMESGFTISTSYGDIQISAADARAVASVVERILTRKLDAARPRLPKPDKALTRCAAARDGDCSHAQCPQERDGEPVKSGRHCPLDIKDDDDA
ncbi:hypothetical protein, partial [Pandoraea terrigena]|uniref:hypothetical protein n=1 Tax=Pandoraea terrigena TaxID=2508292 RepID=UPI00123F0790